MFKTDLARKNWETKYQYKDETPFETQKRLAKEVASVEDNPEEWEDKFLRVLVKFDENEKPVGLKNTFGGRITANLGTDYDGTTLINCFSGEEEILTDKGIGSFREFEGQKVNVLADGEYIEAEIDKFGKQQLQRITFRPCYKQDPIFDNQTSPIFVCKHGRYALSYKVTPNHTWILSDGEETDDIKVGDVVQSSVSTFNEGSCDYKSGFRHGFICGDGSDQYTYKNGDHRYVLRLFGEKDMKYAHMFDEVKEGGHMRGLGGETIVRSDVDLKEPPIFGLSANYYAGFIYGILAADGCVLDQNRVELSSTNTEIINWVRKYAPYAGMLAIGYRVDYHSLETNFGKRKELLKRLTLTKRDDIYFKATSIEYLIEEEEVYCAIVDELKKFTLSSGVLTHNCFVNGPVSSATISYEREVPGTNKSIPVEIKSEDTSDNLANIMLTLLEQAETLKSEGGYGINFGFIRPRGTPIKSIGIRHPGVVHYMKIWDVVASVIVMGDNDGYTDDIKNHIEDLDDSLVAGLKKQARKGAQMAVLPIWHPDVEEFVRAKQEEGKLTKFNISVLVDDKFMNAVIEDDFYDLHFNGKVYKRIKARDLYDVIVKSSHSRNEPGVLFYDSMQRNNPLSYLGPLNSTNPCGEIGGNPQTSTVCLLGSINLTQYVNYDRTFDWEQYKSDIAVFARMLDNINDLTTAPLPQYIWAIKNIRQYGMGINGLGSALYMMGIPYNSEKACEFTQKATWWKEEITWRTSAELAREKGPFPAYTEEFLETDWFKSFTKISHQTKNLIKKYGVRNGKTTTNPPLGNTSIICDIVTNGIEPVFSQSYMRTYIVEDWPEGLNKYNIKKRLSKTKQGDAVVWEGKFKGKHYLYEPHNRGLCLIDEVMDYGYKWVMDNYPEDIENEEPYLISAQELEIVDHMNIQAIVQENCNQSVSKCLVEGQEVETTSGYINIEDFIDSEIVLEEGFYKAIDDVKVFDSKGNETKVLRAYYGGKKPSYEITFDNGVSVRCSESHQFKSVNGDWLDPLQLSEGSMIVKNNSSFTHGSGGIALNFNDFEFNTNANKINIPRNMSVDLAKLLGMICADGHVGKNNVNLTEKDDVVAEEFDRLSWSLFKYKPKVSVDKRNGVRTRSINSRVLSNIVGKLIGITCYNRVIPKAVLYGSESEKKAFLEGVSLDGYYIQDRGSLCLYCGSSRELADGIRKIASQIYGSNNLYYFRKLSENGFVYGVLLQCPHDLVPIEIHKRKECKYSNSNVYLSRNPAEAKYVKGNYSLNGLRRRGSRVVRRSVAEKNYLEYVEYSTVKSIEYIGEQEVFDIEVEGEHQYLVSGIISHNTCNLPEDYSFENYKELYIKAWQMGLNGFTTYREGSMEAVLSTVERNNGSREIIKKDIKLPDVFHNGPMHVIRREGMKFYINFSYLPEDDAQIFPVAMWIHTNSFGEIREANAAVKALIGLLERFEIDEGLIANQKEKIKGNPGCQRVAKMISMCLRHNIPIVNIVHVLDQLEDVYVTDTIFAVKKFLSENIEEGTPVVGAKCSSCKSSNIVYTGGCSLCQDCGASGCE